MNQVEEPQGLSQDINALVQRMPIEVMQRMPDIDAVLDYLLSCISEVVDSDVITISLLDGDKVRNFRSYYPKDLSYLQANDVFNVDEYVALKQAYTTHQPVLTADTHNHPGWIIDDRTKWIRSHIAIPMFTQDEFFGFIFLQGLTPNQFSDQDVRRIQPLVAQTSLAVHLATIYRQQEQTTSELEALYNATSVLLTTDNVRMLGGQIAEAVVKEFAHVDCGVILVDLYSPQLERLPRAGIEGLSTAEPLYLDGPGLVPSAIRSGITTYAPDVSQDTRYVANVPEAKSELVIPLRTNNNIIGVLDLQSTQTHSFSPNDVRVLEAFSQRAAVAIENARLYEEIRTFATDQEQLLAERTLELREAKEQVETILNYSSDGVAFTTQDGHIIRTNTAFEKIFGPLTHTDENLSIVELIDIDPQQSNDCAAALVRVANGVSQSERLIATTINRDTNPTYIDTTLAAVRNSRDHVSGIVFTIRDISDLKKMEEGLRDALAHEMELNQLKSQFIAVVSHEFRTPLATILSAKDGLERYYDRMNDQQRARNFNQIDSNVTRMTEMLNDLLSLTLDETPQKQKDRSHIDLSAVFRSAYEDLLASIGTGYDITFDVTGEVQHVRCDITQMQHIFINLVENAIKYSSEGKVVRVTLDYQEDQWQLTVSDTGIGIPEADQSHIFDPFIRGANVGNKRGTGLGLSIVERAVRHHDGKIEFSSIQDKGTTFIVTIPYSVNQLDHSASGPL